eukprot:TRINITY_DN121272_c0_g1_i1.p1 TRINITY_DN121272_c0_g1~~TRINITY_DN121272_c0_g1_i1.p1  ORF type:complete len:343 (-),score=13.14 TRINITY_DN121272_c0_g1_i1:212-1240(-)
MLRQRGPVASTTGGRVAQWIKGSAATTRAIFAIIVIFALLTLAQVGQVSSLALDHLQSISSDVSQCKAAAPLDSNALRESQVVPMNPDKDWILIYSLGKTATSSLMNTLGKMYSENGLVIKGPKAAVPGKYQRGAKTDSRHDMAEDLLKQAPVGSKVWVITIVRSPCTRWFSMFIYCRNKLQDRIFNMSNTAGVWISKVGADFTMSYSGFLPGKGSFPLNKGWIAQEEVEFWPKYKQLIGVDLLQERIDATRGHFFRQISSNGRTLNLIALPYHRLRHWDSILEIYFPGFRLRHDNVRETLPLYKALKSEYRYTTQTLAHIASYANTPLYSTGDVHKCLCKP